MRRHLVGIGIASAVLTLSGCSIDRTDTDLKVVTGKQVGVNPQDVAILSREGGTYNPIVTGFTGHVDGFTWNAQTPKGNYSCEGDVNLDRVLCAAMK